VATNEDLGFVRVNLPYAQPQAFSSLVNLRVVLGSAYEFSNMVFTVPYALRTLVEPVSLVFHR